MSIINIFVFFYPDINFAPDVRAKQKNLLVVILAKVIMAKCSFKNGLAIFDFIHKILNSNFFSLTIN